MRINRRYGLRRLGVAALGAAALALGPLPAFAQDPAEPQEGQEVAPEDAAPEDLAPEDAAPEDAAPEDAPPEDAAPEDAAPEDAPPEDAAARQQLEDVLAAWPEGPRSAVQKLTERYGEPDAFTESLVVWTENAPWKRTVVYRDPVEHLFPVPHEDYVEQFIDYRVPVDQYDELAAYDGSVVARRTQGELSARCDQEAANFLALNLADQLVTGQLDVASARDAYAEAVQAMQRGETPELMQGFAFEVPEGETADPDRSTIPGTLEELAELQLEERSVPAGQPKDAAPPASADEAIRSWPEELRETAQTLIERHGEPDELTHGMLIWRQSGPWKRTVIYRDPAVHLFPKPHYDYVEQVIDYQAPVDRFDDVAEFDGSVTLDRTQGEMAARCDQEAANVLAVNLAHDVAQGSKTVDEAREAFTEAVQQMTAGHTPESTLGFTFELPTPPTQDPDEPHLATGAGDPLAPANGVAPPAPSPEDERDPLLEGER